MKHQSGGSRSSRVASEIKKVVCEALIRGDINHYSVENIDPRMIVITGVEVSPCLQHAKIFINTVHESFEVHDCVEFMTENASQIRRIIGARIKLKFVPELKFYPDFTEEQANKIEEILRSCRV